MKKMIQSKKFHYLWIFLLLASSFIYTGCKSSVSTYSSLSPYKARLCGRYSKDIYLALEDTSPKIQLLVFTYFAEGYIEKEIPLNDDGTFTIDIPVVSATLCRVGLEGYYIVVFLLPEQKTEFELTVGKSRKRNLKMIESSGWTEEEFKEESVQYNDIAEKIIPNWDFKRGISTEEYQQYVIRNLAEIKKEVESNTEIMYLRKQSIKNTLRMSYLYRWVLSSEETEISAKQPLENASDFTFLKNFNLNNPYEFLSQSYHLVFRKILETEVFNIPPIGETPVQEWLKGVKSIMADLIGSDTGFFYDLLAANSYYLQLKRKAKPFSEKQIENMNTYFQNTIYTDVLMAENEKIIEHIRSNKKETPDVPKEELLEAIVSRYQGKVVVVDFWATWCLPCLNTMRISKEMKEELEGKDVVFIYISAPSSDKKGWEKITQEIKGEHYFLYSEDEWNYILLDQFHFNGIPSYLIYDSDGNLKSQFTSYPGNEMMREMIEKLLP